MEHRDPEQAAVAIAEGWTPSRRMRAAAAAERESVERKLKRLAMRETALAAELASVQAERAGLEQQRHILGQFVDDEAMSTPRTRVRRRRTGPDSDVGQTNGATVLRGARIRETAVRVLAAKGQSGTPVHYRDWFGLLAAQGFMPAGKDPLATFLTQIRRSPLVRPTTSSGTYVVDAEFPRNARQRLTRLGAELSKGQAKAGTATVEEIAAARERRVRLTAQIQETERQLEEALRSLRDPDASQVAAGAVRCTEALA